MAEAPSTPLPVALRLADNLLDGELADFIAERRPPNPKRSWDTIARELWDETDHEIAVTGHTVAKWADLLGIEAGAA